MNFDKVNAVHKYTVDGIEVKTGDLICTTDGGQKFLAGQFWWLIGKIIPGDVDHIVVYTGPGGRCVEAGATGLVAVFDIPNEKWDSDAMDKQRGGLIDTIYGVADPVKERDIPEADEEKIRIEAANYCLEQAKQRKPYNIIFIASDTEYAFYCSQLAYKAYKPHGINLNIGIGAPNIPFTDSIVFPQEVWEACKHKTKL